MLFQPEHKLLVDGCRAEGFRRKKLLGVGSIGQPEQYGADACFWYALHFDATTITQQTLNCLRQSLFVGTATVFQGG